MSPASRLIIIYKIKAQLTLDLSKSKLNELERRFGIPSVRRKKLAPEEEIQVVLDEVEQDVTQHNGPNYFKGRLKDRDIKIPRCVK